MKKFIVSSVLRSLGCFAFCFYCMHRLCVVFPQYLFLGDLSPEMNFGSCLCFTGMIFFFGCYFALSALFACIKPLFVSLISKMRRSK